MISHLSLVSVIQNRIVTENYWTGCWVRRFISKNYNFEERFSRLENCPYFWVRNTIFWLTHSLYSWFEMLEAELCLLMCAPQNSSGLDCLENLSFIFTNRFHQEEAINRGQWPRMEPHKQTRLVLDFIFHLVHSRCFFMGITLVSYHLITDWP